MPVGAAPKLKRDKQEHVGTCEQCLLTSVLDLHVSLASMPFARLAGAYGAAWHFTTGMSRKGNTTTRVWFLRLFFFWTFCWDGVGGGRYSCSIENDSLTCFPIYESAHSTV